MMGREKPIQDERLPDDARFRRYLLGLCTPMESDEIEHAILGEGHAIWEIIEDELIEEYVTGELNQSDRSHFESRFLFSQQRLEKIRLSAMLLGRRDVAEGLSGRIAALRQTLPAEPRKSHVSDAPTPSGLQFHSFDESYLKRLGAGDRRANEHFLAYFSALMQIKLHLRLKSPEAIEDVRQETFARFFGALRDGRILQPERLGSFVNSICNNVLRERSRASLGKVLADEGSPDLPAEAAVSLGAASSKQTAERIREILKQLPEQDRRLLSEVFLERRDKEEVCRELGVDRSHLRALLHRAKRAFKERMDSYPEAGSEGAKKAKKAKKA